MHSANAHSGRFGWCGTLSRQLLRFQVLCCVAKAFWGLVQGVRKRLIQSRETLRLRLRRRIWTLDYILKKTADGCWVLVEEDSCIIDSWTTTIAFVLSTYDWRSEQLKQTSWRFQRSVWRSSIAGFETGISIRRMCEIMSPVLTVISISVTGWCDSNE